MCENKCSYPDGVKINISGIDVDPCVFKDIEKYANVTVTISRCIRCGRINIEWERQDDTEEIQIEEPEENDV